MIILDLKQVGDKYVLWCMDSFTRFIQGKLLNNKKRDTILNATDECWNIPFGKPTIGFYADDDTEYEVKIENLINKGITMNYDPTYSPWSNDIDRKNHASGEITIKKLMEDKKI